MRQACVGLLWPSTEFKDSLIVWNGLSLAKVIQVKQVRLHWCGLCWVAQVDPYYMWVGICDPFYEYGLGFKPAGAWSILFDPLIHLLPFLRCNTLTRVLRGCSLYTAMQRYSRTRKSFPIGLGKISSKVFLCFYFLVFIFFIFIESATKFLSNMLSSYNNLSF